MDRFWNKVKKTKTCWNWTGASRGDGYGAIKIDGKVYNTHRISWQLHFGSIPDNKMVCHTCDNRSCVNPEHLYLGTARENVQDMIIRKRRRRNILTDTDVEDIRMLAETMTPNEIADKYKISGRYVRKLISGERR